MALPTKPVPPVTKIVAWGRGFPLGEAIGCGCSEDSALPVWKFGINYKLLCQIYPLLLGGTRLANKTRIRNKIQQRRRGY